MGLKCCCVVLRRGLRASGVRRALAAATVASAAAWCPVVLPGQEVVSPVRTDLLRDGPGSVGMTVDNSGKVEQHVQYYPYGEPHREPQGQPYLYGGKERRRFGGLNDYDFHARFLNPAAALWHAPDPHASRYPWLSPYAFCASNPVRYSDPTGMVISTMIDGVRYTYERGQQGWNFYSDGKIYDGDNQYVSELLRSLRTLKCKAVGNALVRSLVEDTEVITIRAPQDGESNMYDHSSRTIVWDSNKKSWGNYTFDGGKWTLQRQYGIKQN